MFTAGGEQPSGESILIEADLAMYDAKDAGRDQYAFYETSEHRISRTKARLTWSNRIDQALEDDRFVLVAQPILDLRTERIRQYELLIRMLDEHDDLIPPAAFLYIAERFGSIAKIDRMGRQPRDRTDRSSTPTFTSKSTSPANRSATQPSCTRSTTGYEPATATPPTSSSRSPKPPPSPTSPTPRSFAQHLRDHGCRFALDDFGAGFGSFYYLKHLPFDYVKIDGEFVKHATSGHIDQLVIEAVVRIARGLGKETIAEFVTNEDTKRMIRASASTTPRATTSANPSRSPRSSPSRATATGSEAKTSTPAPPDPVAKRSRAGTTVGPGSQG